MMDFQTDRRKNEKDNKDIFLYVRTCHDFKIEQKKADVIALDRHIAGWKGYKTLPVSKTQTESA